LFDSEGSLPEWQTIGFKPVEPGEGTSHHIGGPISPLITLFSTIMEAHDARYTEDKDFVRTIAIPILGINTNEFDISRERSEELYQSGKRGRKSSSPLGTLSNMLTNIAGIRLQKRWVPNLEIN
jgi:NTE family protein